MESRSPHAPLSIDRIIDRVVTGPVLNRIVERGRLRPCDVHEVDDAPPAEVDEHPLRTVAEVRIAFPESGGIAVVDARISVIVRLIDRVAAARQSIAIGRRDRFCRFIRCGPVALPVCRIAPRAARIPMPRFAAKFRGQSIRQRLKTCRQHGLHVGRRENLFRLALAMGIDRRSERDAWIESGHDVRTIDGQRRSGQERSEQARYYPARMIHIHNGDSTAMTARRANIPGRHVAFRETLITGPTPAELPQHEWIEQRARFLSENYDQNLLRTRTELLDQEMELDQSRHEDEVVLWFEHDLFCLINFLYLLIRLAKARHLSMIWCPNPLGVMPEPELINVYNSRAAVAPAMIRAATRAWSAYTAADPTEINRFVSDTFDFAFLREGFLLHATRFPSVRNGLGEVERRAMDGIAAGATDFLSLFTRFDH